MSELPVTATDAAASGAPSASTPDLTDGLSKVLPEPPAPPKAPSVPFAVIKAVMAFRSSTATVSDLSTIAAWASDVLDGPADEVVAAGLTGVPVTAGPHGH